MSKWDDDYFWYCETCGAVAPALDIEESALQLFDNMRATHKNCGGKVDVVTPKHWGWEVHTLTELSMMSVTAREKEVTQIMDEAQKYARSHRETLARQAAFRAKCCPQCGAPPQIIEEISTIRRAFSVAAWGLASNKIGKTKRCKKCGHMW